MLKRLFVLTITIFLLLGCTGCKSKDLEELSSEKLLYHQFSKFEKVQLEFDDGTLTVYWRFFNVDPSSPSGVSLDREETYEYEYTLDGENYVIVDGETYYYEVTKFKPPEYDKKIRKIEFSAPFLGIAEVWY